jgi:hypothetical protein
MSGGELAMPSYQQAASGMVTDAQPHVQQRQQQPLQHQSSHDQRMRGADGAGGSGDTSDSDSCRSGDSDGEDDGLTSMRSTAMQTEQNGQQNSGGRHDASPLRPGTWAPSQQFDVKQEPETDRSAGRSGQKDTNRTKKPHLKVAHPHGFGSLAAGRPLHTAVHATT